MGLMEDVEAARAGGTGFEQQTTSDDFLNDIQRQRRGMNKPPPPIYRNVYDVTLGSLSYGAADTAGLLAKGLPMGLSDTGPMVAAARTLDRYKQDHSEYSPVEVHSAGELLRDPMAMSSRLFNGLPQMAAGVGAVAVPYVGVPMSAGLSATIEGQRAYEDAKASFASEDEAIRAGRATGLAAGFLDTMLNMRVLSFARGKEGALARNVESRVTRMLRAAKLPPDAIGLVVSGATISAVQGGVNDGIAVMTYGKEVKEGFFDRRMQEAIGGGAMAGTFGAVLHYARIPRVNPDGTTRQVRLDTYDRDSFHEYLVREAKMEPVAARAMSETMDTFARNWGSRNNQPVESFYGQFLDGPAPSAGANAEVTARQFYQLFNTPDPKVAVRKFADLVTPLMSPSDVQVMRDNNLNTPKQISDAFTKYLGEGHAPAPELIEPFEFFKDTLKDVWGAQKAEADRTIGEYEQGRADYKTISSERYPVQTKGPIRSFAARKVGDQIEIAKFHEDFGPGIPYPQRDLFLSDQPIELGRGEKKLVDPTSGKYLTPPDLSKGIERKAYDEAVQTKQQLESPITSPLRAAFDRVLSIDTDQIGEARNKLYAGEQDLLSIKKANETKFVPFTEDELSGTASEFRMDAWDWLKGRASLNENTRRALPGIRNQLEANVRGQEQLIQKLEEKRQQMTPEQWVSYVPRDILGSDLTGTGEYWINRSRSSIDKYRQEITKLSSEIPQVSKIDPIGPPEPGNLFRMGKTEVELRSEAVNAMYEDLRRLQLGRELPDRDSAVARRAAPGGVAREAIRLETPEQRVVRNRFQSALDSAEQFFADFSAPLTKTKWGQKGLDILSDVLTHRRNIQSDFEEENTRTRLKLTKRDKDWMLHMDPVEAAKTGLWLTNMRRYLDPTGVPNPIVKAPSQAIEDYRFQAAKINQTLGKTAEREGVTIELSDGSKVPFKTPVELRMFRFFNDDGRAAIERRNGPIYDAIKGSVELGAKLAGHDKETISGMTAALSDYVEGTGIRESGPLTDARKVRYMPDAVEVNGKVVPIMHTNPDEYLTQAVRTQAYQLGWNRVAGIKNLDPVPIKQVKGLLEAIGVEPARNPVTIRKMIEDKGIKLPEHISDMKTLEAFAEQVGVQPKPRRKEYIESLNKLTIDDFKTKASVTQLRETAKAMEGIDPNLPLPNLLDEVKRRVVEKQPDVIEILTKNLQAEGGDTALLADVFRLAQGIPIYKSRKGEFRERQGFVRGAHFVSGIAGTAQTSTAAVPNIFQTPVQVPAMTGWKNFFGAVDGVLKDYAGHRQKMIALGAITDTHQAWALEPGYKMEGIVRNLRQLVQTGTGMKLIGDINNVIAGEAHRRLAMEWQRDPKNFKSGDIQLAKRLELTPAQISEIQAGKMSDFTFRKIVQQGVAKTQYTTESAHRRAIIENHPVWRMLFAYNSYAAGTLRSTADMMRSGVESFRSGDTSGQIRFGGRLLATVAGGLGAGAMVEMMRDVIRGNVSQDQNESTLEKAAAATLSVQLLGPPQRLLESIKYDTGSTNNWIVGLMPQVRFVADGLGLAYNAAMQASGEEGRYGTYSKFGIGKQVQETALRHTPLAKSFVQWFHNTAYPNEPVYNEVKASVGNWRTETLGEQRDAGEFKLNPDYYDTWLWAKRNDPEMAMKAAQEYYTTMIQRVGEDPDKMAMKGIDGNRIRTNLRASLVSRAPINLRAELIPVYLNSLPEDRREKFLVAHARYMAIVNSVAPDRE